MPSIGIADKTTLDSVNTKVGATGDAANASGSIFARLAEMLTNRLTAARAAFLDVAISSRAAAATALSNAQWTNTRAGYLDDIPKVSIASANIKVTSAAQKTTSATGNPTMLAKRFLVTYDGIIRVIAWGAAATPGGSCYIYAYSSGFGAKHNQVYTAELGTAIVNGAVFTQVNIDIPVKSMDIVYVTFAKGGDSGECYIKDVSIAYDLIDKNLPTILQN
jgi:hypothetical protein